MIVDNHEITITGKLIKTANVAPECYEDIEDSESLIKEFKKAKWKVDIFSFGQRLPETKPIYNYYMEWESVAAISVESFDHWWGKQIRREVRKKVRKAKKKGVVVKVVDFNNEFVKGITSIYNESPIRQGKPFWHYQKDFDTVKKEISTYLDRSDFIGAYYKDELIGFIKLFYSEKCASTMQVISKIKHRDKAPTNALIAKTVEICDGKRIPYLVYGVWSKGTLGDFKRYNGFDKLLLPRYYIPLTIKGKVALKLHLHHGFAGILPKKLILRLKDLRDKLYLRKYRKY